MLALGLAVVLLVVGVTATLLLDHPLAAAGVGTTPSTAFESVDEVDRPFVAELEIVTTTSAGSGTRRVTMVRRPDGTEIRTFRVSASGSVAPPDVTTSETVVFEETGYERLIYRTGVEPYVVEPHVLRRGTRTYERVDGSKNVVRSTGLWYTLARVAFVRNGSSVRNGESLRVYEAVSRRTDGLALLDRGGASGRVLVDQAGRLRTVNVTIQSPRGGETSVRYDVELGESRSVPGWVSTARTLPPEPPAGGADRPSVAAYRSTNGLVLVANGSWTPPRDTRLFVFFEDRERVQVSLNDSRSVFRPSRNGSHVAYVVPSADGASIQDSLPAGEAQLRGHPTRIVVDRRGVNYYDQRVRSTRALGWWRSIEAAHLRPSNGGGRVVHVSSYSVTDSLPDSAPVSFVVGNESVRQSVTVSKDELDDGRVYLVRTPDGLAAMTDPPLAPMNLSVPGGVADRRFVANATLTVVVNGVPVKHTGLAERVTRASGTPRSELLTGISMRLADDPSDLEEHRRDDVAEYDWSNHTVLSLHNWNYDTLAVTDDDGERAEKCPLDHTCFYRIADGNRVRIETGNGTVLFEDSVNGTREVAP